MKILQIINSFEGGGAEIMALHLHEALLNYGIDSYAVSLIQSSADNLPNTYSLGFDSPYKLSVIIKLYFFLRQPQWKDLDIIHVHLFPAQFYTPVISKLLGLKAILITTEHSSYNNRRKYFWGKFIDGFLYRFYTKITCVSYPTLKKLLHWQSQLAAKLLVIHCGIDYDQYSSGVKVYSQGRCPVIISVGRLVEPKNYEGMLRGLSKISNLAFEYWILGTGPLEMKLKSLVNELNLDTKVKFLGFRQDVPNLLHQADIFLQVSLWEGLSLAMLEAMATGLPVVVSDIPEAKEVVNNESKAGLIANPVSEDDIADKVSELINNPSLRITMGKNAQIRASEFDIKRIFQEYIHLYSSVCLPTN